MTYRPDLTDPAVREQLWADAERVVRSERRAKARRRKPTSPVASSPLAPQPISDAEPAAATVNQTWNRRIIRAWHLGIQQGRAWGLQDATMTSYYPNLGSAAAVDQAFADARLRRWQNIAQLD